MLSKILISCALFVAAQCAYAPPIYGSPKSSIAGYAAQLQPAVSVSVLPSYGPVPAYGRAPAYAPAPANIYLPAPTPAYGPARSYGLAGGVDAEALNLAKLVFVLPSPGGPNPAVINVPKYSTTSYTAPAVVLSPSNYGNALSGSSAAAAASNVKLASSGYGPNPAPAAGSGYGPAPISYV